MNYFFIQVFSYSYIYSVGTKLTKYHNETVILNYEDKRNLQL